MKLSELKEKGVDNLTDEEKAVLRRNEDKLPEEDKEFFKSVLEEELETDESLTFANEAELDKYFDEREERKRQEAEEAKRQEELEKQGEIFFDKDNLPLDWNDAFRKATPKIISAYEKKQQEARAEAQKKIDEINAGFDAEMETMKSEGEDIPDKGTPERQELDQKLAKIGIDYGVRTMKGAYKIYKADLSPNDNSSKPVSTPKTNPGTTQKTMAKRVGKSGGNQSKPEIKYSDIKGKSMDELIDEEMETLE